MKYISFAASLVLLIALQTGLTSCNSSPTSTTLAGSWDKLGDCQADPRSGAVGFIINGICYFGTGFNYELAGQTGTPGRLKDFWKYDPSSDTWTRVADFGGVARSGAVAFAMNGKGYVGTGTDDGLNPLSDFWEYDPTIGSKGQWKRIADLGHSVAAGDTNVIKRYGAIAFTVKNRGFVGGGHYISDLKDLWEYNPATNEWKTAPSIGGSKRQNGFSFVIDDIAYVGGGTDNGVPARDFYKFDVSLLNPDGTGAAWTALNGLTGKDANGNAIAQPRPRELATTFSIGGYGFLTCGAQGSVLNDTWRYDPSTDTWLQYFSFANNTPVTGASRSSAVGFSVGDFGYLVAGGAGNVKYDDVWKFNPAGIEPDNK